MSQRGRRLTAKRGVALRITRRPRSLRPHARCTHAIRSRRFRVTTPARQNLQVTSVAVEEIIDGAPGQRVRRRLSLSRASLERARLSSVSTWPRSDASTARRAPSSCRVIGPLVSVLQEALTRDEFARLGARRAQREPSARRSSRSFRTSTTSETRAFELRMHLSITSSSSTRRSAPGTTERPLTS